MRGCCQLVHHDRIVHGDEQPIGPDVERGEAGDLGSGHDLGEEQHARNPGVGHHLGLGQCRAALAEGAGLDLALGHLDRLVDLGDRPDAMPGLTQVVGEVSDVAFQPVEVEYQRGR